MDGDEILNLFELTQLRHICACFYKNYLSKIGITLAGTISFSLGMQLYNPDSCTVKDQCFINSLWQRRFQTQRH